MKSSSISTLLGILTVSASDKGTGKSTSVTIDNQDGRLSMADIERMIAESERFSEEDLVLKKKAGAQNELETWERVILTPVLPLFLLMSFFEMLSDLHS